MSFRVSHLEDAKLVPWANGKGQTRELARREINGALLYRISVADVVEAGAFSTLPGLDRHLVLLNGAGFDLEINGAVRPVQPFVPVAFSGDDVAAAVNVSAPSQDFNVMSARGKAQAEVRVATQGFDEVLPELGFYYVAAGGFMFSPLGATLLETGTLVEAHGAQGGSISVGGQGSLICVRISIL